MINITSWAYYPNPPTYTHNESMNDLLNSDNFRLRLVLWKNFPDHERSINKNSTEMNIQNVPIYYPTSKKYKTLLGIGYFSYPSTKVEIEIFNETYSLKDLEKNFHVIAEPTKNELVDKVYDTNTKPLPLNSPPPPPAPDGSCPSGLLVNSLPADSTFLYLL